MTAFLELLNTFAIWIYLGCVIAILFGIKMLFDARRAARTTLFTLEQEQASDRAFRAFAVMMLATLIIGSVAAVNAFVVPAVPPPDDTALANPTEVPYTPPIILDTPTPNVTETAPPITGEATTAATAAPATAPPVAPVATVAPPPTVPVETPTPLPEPTSVVIYPSPPLNTPPNGDSIGSNNIRFSWGANPDSGGLDVPELLPQDQFYRVVVGFTSKSKNAPGAIVVCTHENSLDRRTGLDLSDVRSDALEGNFSWSVLMVRSPSQQACESGEFSPLSPPSATFAFKLP